MYYKEEWINGKLCWKSTPNGEWIPFTIGQYKERVLKSEAELKNLHKANVIKSVCECMQNLYKDGIFIKCKKCNKTINVQEQTVL